MWALDNPNAHDEIAAYRKFNQDIPDSLIPPDLHDVEEYIWDAFWELSTDRQVGMGPGPIPHTSIQRMAGEFSALGGKTFQHLIRAMDVAYLGHKSGKKKTFSRNMMKG